MAYTNSINSFSSASGSQALYLLPVARAERESDATVAPSDTPSSAKHQLTDREVFALLTKMIQTVMQTIADKSSVLGTQGLNQQQTLTILTKITQALGDEYNAQLTAAAAAAEKAKEASFWMHFGMFLLQTVISVCLLATGNVVGAIAMLVTAVLTAMPINSSGGTLLEETAKAAFPNDEKGQKIFTIVAQVVLGLIAIGAGGIAGAIAANSAKAGAFGAEAAATMATTTTGSVIGTTAAQVGFLVGMQVLFASGAIQKIVQKIGEATITDEKTRQYFEMVVTVLISVIVMIGGAKLASKMGNGVSAGALMSQADSTSTSKMANLLNSLGKVINHWYVQIPATTIPALFSLGWQLNGAFTQLRLSEVLTQEGATKGRLDLTTALAQSMQQAEQRTAQEGTAAIQDLSTTINVAALTMPSQALSQAV